MFQPAPTVATLAEVLARVGFDPATLGQLATDYALAAKVVDRGQQRQPADCRWFVGNGTLVIAWAVALGNRPVPAACHWGVIERHNGQFELAQVG